MGLRGQENYYGGKLSKKYYDFLCLVNPLSAESLAFLFFHEFCVTGSKAWLWMMLWGLEHSSQRGELKAQKQTGQNRNLHMTTPTPRSLPLASAIPGVGCSCMCCWGLMLITSKDPSGPGDSVLIHPQIDLIWGPLVGDPGWNKWVELMGCSGDHGRREFSVLWPSSGAVHTVHKHRSWPWFCLGCLWRTTGCPLGLRMRGRRWDNGLRNSGLLAPTIPLHFCPPMPRKPNPDWSERLFLVEGERGTLSVSHSNRDDSTVHFPLDSFLQLYH